MTGPRAAVTTAIWFALAVPSLAEEPAPPLPATPEDTLTLLSVDVRTMPGFIDRTTKAEEPRWRTSFGSERRSPAALPEPNSGVDADIVLLQGVTDVPMLRRWFPAGKWRLVVSRQLLTTLPEGATAPPAPPPPSTAVAVRLRRGLRLTAQTHLLDLADDPTAANPSAAGTAVRVLIDNRETWAVSVLLPEDCGGTCTARAAFNAWQQARAAENVRRVTGGRFEIPAGPASAIGCNRFGLRLDPPPPPPRTAYTQATLTPELGCAATVSVAK